MENGFSVERKVELEGIVKENIMIIRSHYSKEELEYLDLGKKMPFKEIQNYLDFYRSHYKNTDEYLFFRNMASFFGISMDYLQKRLTYLIEIQIASVTWHEMALLLLNSKRILQLEKNAQNGLGMLDMLYLTPVEKKYVALSQKMSFSALEDNEQISKLVNENAKTDMQIRSIAYMRIKNYLFSLYNNGELSVEDIEWFKGDIMARENRHMIKKMNGRIV